MLGDDTMTTDSNARCCLMLAGVLGFALATAEHAQTQPTLNVTDKGAKRTKTVQPPPAAAHATIQQSAKKTDADQPDMIMLQEPFRSGSSVPVSVTRGR